MTTIDHELIEKLAHQAWADSDRPDKAKTWQSAHQNHWRSKALSVYGVAKSSNLGAELVSAIWGIE